MAVNSPLIGLTQHKQYLALLTVNNFGGDQLLAGKHS